VTAFVVALTSAALLAQKPPPQSRILGSRNRTGINRKRQVNLFDPDGTRVEARHDRRPSGALLHAPASPVGIPGTLRWLTRYH
jgi:hypothetical protein